MQPNIMSTTDGLQATINRSAISQPTPPILIPPLPPLPPLPPVVTPNPKMSTADGLQATMVARFFWWRRFFGGEGFVGEGAIERAIDYFGGRSKGRSIFWRAIDFLGGR